MIVAKKTLKNSKNKLAIDMRVDACSRIPKKAAARWKNAMI